jgi:hypothetical protein
MLTPEEIEKLWNAACSQKAEPGWILSLRTTAAQAVISRFAALVEAKALEEREALERRRDALLCTRDVVEQHAALTNGLAARHAVCFVSTDSATLDEPLGATGKGPDYWQALRAALDEAGKGKP